MRVDGREYEFIRAGDGQHDGMGLECHRLEEDGESTMVLEAFWHDPTGRFTFWSCSQELPFALVREFVRMALEACPPLRSDEKGTMTLIYIGLLDEGTNVWRPVRAELRGEGVFRIADEQPEGERWEFPPGALVRCVEHRFSDGSLGLVAKEQCG